MPDSSTCAACHPKIVHEYERSMHANSSIYNDVIHKAVWDRHPDKKHNNYKCAKCHTPADHDLIEGKYKLGKNYIQTHEPISCQSCHQIKSIEKHKQSNTNKYIKKKKYFFSADEKKKGTIVSFHEKSSFWGLVTKISGSPYHDIDYGNENYYNGNVCMGCHDHKRNESGFAICDLSVDQGSSHQTCISCHMPQIKGSFVNLKSTSTHAYHGISIHNGTPQHLAQYIDLNLTVGHNGFDVKLHNQATHALFVQPLRLGQLRVLITRNGASVHLKTVDFHRVIGKDGRPAMPWLADTVLADTTIRAHETRVLHYGYKLQKGDMVTLELGYYLVNPKAADKLGIKDRKATSFIVLTRSIIQI
jgi:hypothetical protein